MAPSARLQSHIAARAERTPKYISASVKKPYSEYVDTVVHHSVAQQRDLQPEKDESFFSGEKIATIDFTALHENL